MTLNLTCKQRQELMASPMKRFNHKFFGKNKSSARINIAPELIYVGDTIILSDTDIDLLPSRGVEAIVAGIFKDIEFTPDMPQSLYSSEENFYLNITNMPEKYTVALPNFYAKFHRHGSIIDFNRLGDKYGTLPYVNDSVIVTDHLRLKGTECIITGIIPSKTEPGRVDFEVLNVRESMKIMNFYEDIAEEISQEVYGENSLFTGQSEEYLDKLYSEKWIAKIEDNNTIMDFTKLESNAVVTLQENQFEFYKKHISRIEVKDGEKITSLQNNLSDILSQQFSLLD